MPSAFDFLNSDDEGGDLGDDSSVDCYTHVVIIEVEQIDPSKPPLIHEVEVRTSSPQSLDNLSPELQAEVGPWLSMLANYADFTKRFGTSQTWSIIGSGIFRGC